MRGEEEVRECNWEATRCKDPVIVAIAMVFGQRGAEAEKRKEKEGWQSLLVMVHRQERKERGKENKRGREQCAKGQNGQFVN